MVGGERFFVHTNTFGNGTVFVCRKAVNTFQKVDRFGNCDWAVFKDFEMNNYLRQGYWREVTREEANALVEDVVREDRNTPVSDVVPW